MDKIKKNDKIAPIIQNKEVISLKINDKTIPLKEPMPTSYFFKEFLDAIGEIERYVDLSNFFYPESFIEKWTNQELEQFCYSLSKTQKIILKILIEENEISRNDLIQKINDMNDKMELDNKKIAGIVAGLNRRINQLRKEKLFYITADIYSINSSYLDFFKNNWKI